MPAGCQYSLVVYTFLSVINDQLDTETLNHLAILCCELTAQCSTLALSLIHI